MVDATNLRQSFCFFHTAIGTENTVVVALNKSDITEKKQTAIDENYVKEELKCPVVEQSRASGHTA